VANDNEIEIKALLALEERRCKALADEDVDTLRDILSVDLTHNHATGKVDNLESYLDYITTGIKFFNVSRTDDLTVELVSEDEAIMQGTLINIAKMRANDGDPKTIESRAEQHWKKIDGQWRVLTFTAKRKA